MDLVSSCKSFNPLQGDEDDALQQTAKSNIIKLRRKFTEQQAVFDRRCRQRIEGLWDAEDEVLVVALLRILPVVSRTLLNKAYRLSLLGTALSSFYSLYTLYGAVPPSLLVDSLQGKKCLSLHKQLVNDFFKNASHMIQPCGEVHSSHKIGDPFHRWNLKEPTLKNSLILTECANFSINDYLGYNN